VGVLAWAGGALLLGFLAIAILAPTLAPPKDGAARYQIPRDGYMAEPQPPGPGHPFGTSQGQYDVYYGVVWGTRTAFRVALVVTLVTLTIGCAFGAVTAYAGGWMDELAQRIVEVFMAFPFVLAALTLATVLVPRLHDRLLAGMIALVAFGWTGYARLIRAEVLSVRERDFVLASRALGTPGWRILLHHVLPNALGSVVVVASLSIGDVVLVFSGLSFLGIGTEPGYADWGQLVSYARNWLPDMARYWYTVAFPGGAIVLFALAWNLIGDGLHAALDPRRR
jgi:peptide/nickel transport system permease protein